MKKRIVLFCFQCKKKLVGYDQDKFCSRKCFNKYRHEHGWFYLERGLKFKHTTNCFNPSRCKS